MYVSTICDNILFTMQGDMVHDVSGWYPQPIVLLCDVVCLLQRNGNYALVDLQYWSYRLTFLSSKDKMNILTSCSFFSPVSIRFGQLMNM